MTRSLYQLTVTAVSDYFKYFKEELRTLPEPLLFDVYMMLYKQNRLCILSMEFSDLDIFPRILKITNNRVILLKCFQDLMTHGTQVSKDLGNSYILKCNNKSMTLPQKESIIDIGIRLGGFLYEAGWFDDSSKVLSACRDLCLEEEPNTCHGWSNALECCHKLLLAEIANSKIKAATSTKKLAEGIVELLKNENYKINLAGLYTNFSLYSYYMSRYDEAYKWSVSAIKELTPESSARVTIDTLSQASKACVVKREFSKASALVRQAVHLARETFGNTHPKYADTLLDYGYFLLSSDSMKGAVTVYETALKLKEAVFGNKNLHVAVAHEDLAYALYVYEYSSGRFMSASKHAELAIKIMGELLPEEHLMMASAQRVKALILEEIALDTVPAPASSDTKNVMLSQAEKLHKDNLRLAQLSFGEDNVQTAKHYGNLGRLYQSMKRYEEAESMHLKAIGIKEKLLGKNDYEVGLSVGHLASLYNYHMAEYRKAETLYYRSIDISLKLFSESYSGLEYDYRGLMHVYSKLGKADKVADFMSIMNHWKELRQAHEMECSQPLAPQPLASIQNLQALFQ